MTADLASEDASVAIDPSFLAALDASPALMWLSRADFDGIYFNRTWRDFTGRTLEQELAGGWMTSVHPEDLDKIEAYGAALTERQPFRVEYRLRRRDGAWRWMLDTGQPHLASDGGFLFYVGSCIDITERKEAEDARIRGEERLKLAQEAAAVGTYDWDVRNDELSWSPEMFRLYAIDPETPPEQIYTSWLSRLHPDDRERADAETREFVRSANELSIEFRIIHPQDGERWIHGRGRMHRDPDGRPVRMIGVNFDITDQRRVEENLRESEQRITDIAENFPGAIFRRITYPDGRVEYPYFSGPDETIFNISRERVMRARTIEEISKLIHYEDLGEMLARLKKATETLTPLEVEGRIIGENGEVAWLRSVSRPRPRADGAVVWDGVMLNVTEQHQRRAERERAATMLRMSMEVAGIGTWEYDPKEGTVRGSAFMNAAFGLPDDGATRPLEDYIRALHAEDRSWVERETIDSGKRRESTSMEYRIRVDHDEFRWMSSVGTFVRLSDGTERLLGAISDITAHKRQEEEREVHLRQQSEVLRQLNHRVKNNLQVVLSLMRMEMRSGPEVDGLARAIARVETVADLHARLSFVSGAGQINFKAFLEDMAEKLRGSLRTGGRVVLECDADTCVLELDRAIPLGVAVHELASALACGSTEGERRATTICLECGPAGAEAVAVTADRAGLQGVNLRLVQGMCRQCGATLEHLEAPAVGHRIRLLRASESS